MNISTRVSENIEEFLMNMECEQVANSDGGVTLSPEQHKEVAQVAGELQKYCVKEPVKNPLIFGGN